MSALGRSLALGSALVGFLGLAPPAWACEPIPQVHVFLIEGASYDELMSIDAAGQLAGHGGSALLANSEELADQARALAPDPSVASGASGTEVEVVELGKAPQEPSARAGFLDSVGDRLASEGALDGEGAVVVATVGEPGDGGVLNGLVIAWPWEAGAPAWPGVVTSSSTRRAGLVTGSDLLPSVKALTCAGPDRSGVIDGPLASSEYEHSPGEVLARHLDVRRIAFPVQAVAGAAVLLMWATGLATFFLRERLPGWTLAVGRWCCLAVPVLGVSLLMSGHLPNLSYASAGGVVATATLLVPILLIQAGRGDTLRPPVSLAIVLLVVMAFEAFSGWGATPYTLLGGTALDGARFYGLPNAFIGVILGSSLYLASVMPRWVGVGVVMAGCLLAGLPSLGANLGGAVTLAAGAGIWAAFSTAGWRRWASGAAVAAAGVALVLAAHSFSDAPTHVTNALVEGGGPGGPLATVADRLGIGLDLLRRSPAGLLYLAATPLLLWLVARPRAGMKDVFGRYPRWREAMVAILGACVVAYFANDTGVAAVGLGFAMAMGGTLYVPLAMQREKMEAT